MAQPSGVATTATTAATTATTTTTTTTATGLSGAVATGIPGASASAIRQRVSLVGIVSGKDKLLPLLAHLRGVTREASTPVKLHVNVFLPPGKTGDKTLNRVTHNLALDTWLLQYIGQPPVTKLTAIISTVIEAEVSPTIREFLLLLGLKLEWEYLQEGWLFRHNSDVSIMITSVSKLERFGDLKSGVPILEDALVSSAGSSEPPLPPLGSITSGSAAHGGGGAAASSVSSSSSAPGEATRWFVEVSSTVSDERKTTKAYDDVKAVADLLATFVELKKVDYKDLKPKPTAKLSRSSTSASPPGATSTSKKRGSSALASGGAAPQTGPAPKRQATTSSFATAAGYPPNFGRQ